MTRFPTDHDVETLARALLRAEQTVKGDYWDVVPSRERGPYRARARAIFSSAQAAYLAEYPDGDWDALEPLNRHGYIREARKEDDIEAERNAPEVGWDTPLTGGLREEQEAARLEIIARGLLESFYNAGAPPWEQLTPSGKVYWLQKSRPILDALNAVDTNQETNR